MRTVTGQFFESKVRLEKITEEGEQAKFNELYVVNSMSFTECEAKVSKYVSQYTSGEFDILTEAHAKYKEIFFSDDEKDDVFYKVKVDFITADEKTGKDKHSKCDYLVQGCSVESARKNTEEVMNDSMADYKITDIHETAIIDYIE